MQFYNIANLPGGKDNSQALRTLLKTGVLLQVVLHIDQANANPLFLGQAEDFCEYHTRDKDFARTCIRRLESRLGCRPELSSFQVQDESHGVRDPFIRGGSTAHSP